MIQQERENTTQTQQTVKHNNDVRFLVNTHSLHNHSHITSALPTILQSASFQIEDQDSLRTNAAGLVRNPKQQKTEAKKKILLEQIMGCAGVPAAVAPTDGSSDVNDPEQSTFVTSLNNDEDLLQVLDEVFGGDNTQPEADRLDTTKQHQPGVEPAASQLTQASAALPVFPESQNIAALNPLEALYVLLLCLFLH